MASPFGRVKNGRAFTNFYIGLQLLLLTAVVLPSILKLMATRRHSMDAVAALSLRIASDSIELEVCKLGVSSV